MQQHEDTQSRNNGHTPAPPAAGAPIDREPSALDMLWDGLPPRVVEDLSKPLDPSLVSYRKGRGGRNLSYLEGHVAIDQANRIFGYGGWGYELVGNVTCRETRSLNPDGHGEQTGEIKPGLLYCATVKVTVPGVPPRTDVGCQPVAEDTPDGHDTAYKGAVTDALKRALRSFGPGFGNALYGDGGEDTITPPLRASLTELAKVQGLTQQRLQEAVRKKTGKELDALPASELAALVQAMVRKLTPPAATTRPTANGSTPT